MAFVRRYCSMWLGWIHVLHVSFYIFPNYKEKAVTMSRASWKSLSEICGLDGITFAVAVLWTLW